MDLKSPTRIQGFKNKGRLLWGLLIFNAVGTVLVAFFLGLWVSGKLSNQQSDVQIPTKQKQNPATSDSAVAFATRFAQQYLYMTPGYEEDYRKRLQPFLVSGMDPQAGVDMSEAKKYLLPHDDIQLWDVRPVASDRSIITLQVTLYNGTKKDNLQRSSRLLNVPVLAQGSKRFAVYENPYFEPLPEKASEAKVSHEKPGHVVSDTNLTSNAKTFLGDFFKEYAEGSVQEISYKVHSDQPIKGLNGLLSFKEVKKMELFRNEFGKYITVAEITYTDPKTGIQMTYPYQLELEQQGDQWYVTSLKHR